MEAPTHLVRLGPLGLVRVRLDWELETRAPKGLADR
jgi:hypothetical protein